MSSLSAVGLTSITNEEKNCVPLRLGRSLPAKERKCIVPVESSVRD